MSYRYLLAHRPRIVRTCLNITAFRSCDGRRRAQGQPKRLKRHPHAYMIGKTEHCDADLWRPNATGDDGRPWTTERGRDNDAMRGTGSGYMYNFDSGPGIVLMRCSTSRFLSVSVRRVNQHKYRVGSCSPSPHMRHSFESASRTLVTGHR